MSKPCAVAALCLAAACAAPPDGGVPIAMHQPVGSAPNGNAFTCTGTWPGPWTPCAYGWASSPVTAARDDGHGLVHLTLLREPMPVDGGASNVYLDLAFDVHDQIASAIAWEETSRAGTLATVDVSDPTGGWIEPWATSRTASLRNAGRFSLTFAWGSISGTYDTAPLSP